MGITRAHELIAPLTEGLARLKHDPEQYRVFNPENGWGNYENLVHFVEEYLLACETHPNAVVHVSR